MHIISEILQDEHRIEIEEFVDFQPASQLIQIKWRKQSSKAASAKLKAQESNLKTTSKVNLLILNGLSPRGKDNSSSSYVYEYRPYRCALHSLNELDGPNDKVEWQEVVQKSSRRKESSADGAQSVEEIVESLKMRSLSSPYVASVERPDGRAVFMGIAGLWSRALSAKRATQEPQSFAGESSDFWSVKLDCGLVVEFLSAKEGNQVQEFSKESSLGLEELARFSSVKISDGKSGEILQQVKIVKLEFHFSDRQASDLFSLPLGFGCEQNPLLEKGNVYVDPMGENQLINLELVALSYGQSDDFKEATQSSLDAASESSKTVDFARVKHPVDQSSRLVLYEAREDRVKLVQDFRARIRYEMRLGESSHECHKQRLTSGPAQTVQGGVKWLNNTFDLSFHNGVSLLVSEYLLEFLFDNWAATDSLEKLGRLLNIVPVSWASEEHFWEQQIRPKHEHHSTIGAHLKLSGARVAPQWRTSFRASVVRVFHRERFKVGPRMRVSNSLRLKQVSIMLFDAKREKKWAELKVNLIGHTAILSFVERAQLFDLSLCSNLEEESMTVSAFFPADVNFVDYLRENKHELVGRFYASASTGGQPDLETQTRWNESQALVERRRIAMSFNWLRVPKLELSIHPSSLEEPLGIDNWELELRMTILERVSPFLEFERVSKTDFRQTSFVAEQTVLLVAQSPEECAQFCRHPVSCRMFSWNNSTRQCKLSRSKCPSSLGTNLGGLVESGAPYELVEEENSSLFCGPEYGDFPWPEASLGELHSMIERERGRLADLLPAATVVDPEEDPEAAREKRSAFLGPESGPHLFSLELTDRSSLANEFAMPKVRRLQNSGLSVSKLPASLDVGSLASESVKLQVSLAFRLKAAAKCYQISDQNSSAGGKLEEWELLPRAKGPFLDESKGLYFSLEEHRQMEEQECALMCFNTLPCASFSHSSQQATCTLLLSSNSPNFSLPANAQPEAVRIKSVEQLEVDQPDCVIAERNHFSHFDQLILPADRQGQKCFDDKLIERLQKADVLLEWSNVSAVEEKMTRQFEDPYEEREICAKKCLFYFDHFFSCLAFDWSLSQRDGRNQSSCQLLLIDKSGGSRVKILRRHLISSDHSRAQVYPPQNATSRYLLSDLSEFKLQTRGGVRRGRATKGSEGASLVQIGGTSSRLNLDGCASECLRSIELDHEPCVLFEFCMVRSMEDNFKLERQCARFAAKQIDQFDQVVIGRSPKDENAIDELDGGKYTPILQGRQAAGEDCSLYLRNDYDSIEQMLRVGAVKQETIFGTLVVGFGYVVMLVWCVLCFIWVIIRCKRLFDWVTTWWASLE